MAIAYTPKAALRWRALGAALSAALLAAVIGGLGAHWIARVLYLAFLVPAVIGLAVGTAVAAAGRAWRLSRPGPAGAVAALGVVVAALVQLGLDYRLDRHRRAFEAARVHDLTMLGADLGDADEERAAGGATVAGFLGRRFGVAGDIDPSSRGLASSLGAEGTIAVAALELLVGAAIAAALARHQAAQPACPRCGAWRAAARLGLAPQGVAGTLVDRLRRGDPGGAAELLAPPDTREHVRLSRLACPAGHDGGGGVVRIEEVRLDRRRRPRWRGLGDLEASAEELSALRAGLEERPA